MIEPWFTVLQAPNHGAQDGNCRRSPPRRAILKKIRHDLLLNIGKLNPVSGQRRKFAVESPLVN